MAALVVNNQNLHIRTRVNTLHYSQAVGYALNGGQHKSNITEVCMISMNDTETTNARVCIQSGIQNHMVVSV